MHGVESKHLYACDNCSIVDKQEVVRERIDQEFEIYTRSTGKSELHGYETYRVCKHCNLRILLRYKSDCKLGYCGVEKMKYDKEGKHYQCPVCNNKFSFVSVNAVETEIGSEK